MKVGDQDLIVASKRLVHRARQMIRLRDNLYVLPGVGYSLAMLVYFGMYGKLLQFLPILFFLGAVALFLKAAKNQAELEELKAAALKINAALIPFFGRAGLELIDFKLEFGRNSNNELMLGDEISPDTCRIWDLKTREKMDKDRFRRDLGNVQETYESVLDRLKAVAHAR